MSDIYQELIAVIDSDVDIDEVGIIMGAPPPSVVVVEHKLGLSMGILKPVFLYAFAEFMSLLPSIPSALSEPLDEALGRRGLNLTKVILLVKGDIGLAINFRKDMIARGLLSCEDEIKFLRMLFSKHPKSPGGWQHRRFCLQRMMAEGIALDVEREQEICRAMAELYPKNYYAWSHRLWLLSMMSKPQVQSTHATLFE